MSLNIENAPAISASTAVGAVLPLSQRVEERHPGRDASAPPKGLQGLAAASSQDDDAAYLLLEDISFVERPLRGDADDDDLEVVMKAECPRAIAILVTARAATAPALQVLASSQPIPPSFPPTGMPTHAPAAAPLQPSVASTPAASPVATALAASTLAAPRVAPVALMPAAMSPAAQHVGSAVLPGAPHLTPAAVPAAAAPVMGEAAALPSPQAAAAVPTGETVVLPSPARGSGTAQRGGAWQREAAASKATVVAGGASAAPTDRVADAPVAVEPVARQEAGNTPVGQGGQGEAAAALPSSAREVAGQQAEQRSGQEAGQARSHEMTQKQRHVEHIKQVQQTNELLARRSAAPEISYNFLTWGPGNAAVIRQPTGPHLPGQQHFTVHTSSPAVWKALSASALPEGLHMQLAESSAAEVDSATDADERRQRKRGREHS